jgi:hypothetical protein
VHRDKIRRWTAGLSSFAANPLPVLVFPIRKKID